MRNLLHWSLSFAAAFALAGLSGCVPPPSAQPLGKPVWPAVADDINVRPSLKTWLHEHPASKIVLRAPRAATNVAEAENASADYNHNYDLVEKAFFKKGYTVRDRAMLANLLKDDKINSYKEIKTRVDTDLIIEISSLRFNDAGDILKTSSYENGDGVEMASAVATMEVKVINVETGEVGALMTLRLPLCSDSTACQKRALAADQSSEGDLPMKKKKKIAHAKHAASHAQPRSARAYFWQPGAEEPDGIDVATNRLAAKLVDTLSQ